VNVTLFSPVSTLSDQENSTTEVEVQISTTPFDLNTENLTTYYYPNVVTLTIPTKGDSITEGLSNVLTTTSAVIESITQISTQTSVSTLTTPLITFPTTFSMVGPQILTTTSKDKETEMDIEEQSFSQILFNNLRRTLAFPASSEVSTEENQIRTETRIDAVTSQSNVDDSQSTYFPASTTLSIGREEVTFSKILFNLLNTTLSENSVSVETTLKPIDFQTKESIFVFVAAPLMKSVEFVSTKEIDEEERFPQINSQDKSGLNGVAGNAISKVTKEEKVGLSFSQILFNLLNETLARNKLAEETIPEEVPQNHLEKVYNHFMSTKSLKSIIENVNATFENSEKEYFDLSALRSSVQNVANLTESSQTDFEKPFHQLLFESFRFSS
jgi:hypothetical protein